MKVLKANGEAALREDGDPVTITLCGRLSLAFKDAERRMAELRAERQLMGRGKATQEDIDRENVEMLVASTRGWNFTRLDGQDFNYSPENARKFWADRRFAGIKEQAIRFVNTDANFMKG